MLEVCVDSVQAAVLAERSGADRIELSVRLEVGGLTPPAHLIEEVRQAIQLPLIVLIRSRPGDFVYSDLECERMVMEATQAIERGADGIAIGGLLHDCQLNLPFLRHAAVSLRKGELVVHRAFDQVPNPESGIETLIELGYQRILTSGGPDHAIDGVPSLAKFVLWARDRIEILPAGGIGPHNAIEILTLGRCKQLHGSFRVRPASSLESNLPDPDAISQTRDLLLGFKTRMLGPTPQQSCTKEIHHH